MKNIINLLKCVLWGTLIVVFVCGCGNSTAQFLEKDTELLGTLVENKDSGKTEVSDESEQLEEKNGSDRTEESFGKEEVLVYVYVCGAVESPGVYALPEGSRVCDAFEIAGGLRADALSTYWNQARLLEDGEKLYVPTTEEAESGVDFVQDEKRKDDDENSSKKININTASLQELMTIPGIGQAKASAIIKYRQEHGSFSSIEEVKKVEGIKDGVYAKMKEYIDIN